MTPPEILSSRWLPLGYLPTRPRGAMPVRIGQAVQAVLPQIGPVLTVLTATTTFRE
jgi:hypothetical protein